MKNSKGINNNNISDDDTNCNWYTRYSHQKIDTGNRGLGNKKTTEDHPDYSIVEISWNTKESPADSRRLVVTQTQVINHQITLVWKILKEQNNNNIIFYKQAHTGGDEEYTDSISAEGRGPSSNECPGYKTKPSDGEAPVPGNVKYHFVVIAPGSTLIRSGSTW